MKLKDKYLKCIEEVNKTLKYIQENEPVYGLHSLACKDSVQKVKDLMEDETQENRLLIKTEWNAFINDYIDKMGEELKIIFNIELENFIHVPQESEQLKEFMTDEGLFFLHDNSIMESSLYDLNKINITRSIENMICSKVNIPIEDLQDILNIIFGNNILKLLEYKDNKNLLSVLDYCSRNLYNDIYNLTIEMKIIRIHILEVTEMCFIDFIEHMKNKYRQN